MVEDLLELINEADLPEVVLVTGWWVLKVNRRVVCYGIVVVTVDGEQFRLGEPSQTAKLETSGTVLDELNAGLDEIYFRT